MSNSNFARGYFDALSALRPLLRALTPINEVKEALVHVSFIIVHCYQECALHDKLRRPDETPRFHLDLRYLHERIDHVHRIFDKLRPGLYDTFRGDTRTSD